ncbi:hypothetical protein GCM10009611_21330 [Arthrobacter roseus]
MNHMLGNASAGKRLLAKILDSVPPTVIMVIFMGIGVSSISTTQTSAAYATVDLTLFLVMSGLTSLLVLGYWIWMWGWEAKAGKTLGNLIMGIKTANEKGLPAGWGSIFVRNLIIGLSGVVPVVGFTLIMISNLWDPNNKRQGWHDRIARTLVFDVRNGRDPLTTGGAEGPASFAPVQPTSPPLQHVGSPIAGAVHEPRRTSAVTESVTTPDPASLTTDPEPPSDGAGKHHGTPSTSVISSVPGFGPPPEPQPTAEAHPDDDVDATRVSSKRPAPSALVLVFDDGDDVEVAAEALIGRNPSNQGGESVGQLIAVADQGRSVSKTHVHLRREGSGVWVTDRNSTNGTSISGTDGIRNQVPGGETLMAEVGSTVHFGDRSFVVGPR